MAASDFAQIQVHGARGLTRAMRQAGVELDDLKAANMAVGDIVLSAANPPRRTGRLAASGRYARAKARARVTYTRPYAAPVHWGWPRRHIEANPWLATAAKVTEPAWQRVYVDAIDDIVTKIEAAGA